MAGEFLFLVAFNIPLQMEKISIRKEFRERTTIQKVTEKFTVRSNYSQGKDSVCKGYDYVE